MKRELTDKRRRRVEVEGRHEAGDPPPQHQAETPVNDNPDFFSGTTTASSFENVGGACIPDSQGRYGSSDDSNKEQIDYAYQLETTPDVVSQTLTFIVIPEIERRVSEIMVPIMFGEACGRSDRRRRIRRRLRVDGFTSFPPDKIMPNEQCEGTLKSSGNKCYVVSGSATVYSADELDAGMIERARESVAKGMQNGMFDQIHEGIVGISYHGNAPQVSSTQNTAVDDNSVNPAVIWGPIVGVAVVGAVIGASLVYRNQKRRNRQILAANSGPLGIRPSTREDFSHREFDSQTESSWNVLAQHSPTSVVKEELGISARELVHSQSEFNRISHSSWSVVSPQSSSSEQDLAVLGMSTRLDGSGFVDINGMTEEGTWEDERVLTD
eukprot:CAMPEP_0202485738 /NCGR_PEP_ID=MMETSP1361-20130828/4501_1 /ASSEMBLY_ACC=CAM_ASM_000849 /TAXON_ID=210615 /ORGANISM="Staurosira complex sp., Strain CCMP2646" /LENGTH=381 /DNA_ID=CAMNT_0049114709 /DNA_START=41 /DNA_END=1186 /DNA_ORIENTATION=-